MDTIDLSDFFITKSQATDFAQRLNTIQDALYTANFNLEKSFMTVFGMQKKDAMIKLFRENNINDGSIPVIVEFLKKLQESVAKLPLITLVIAFEPTDETLKALSQWFLFTLKKQVIFDIHINKNLIAGATISVSGKFKDYSLKETFEKIVHDALLSQSTKNQTELKQHSEQL